MDDRLAPYLIRVARWEFSRAHFQTVSGQSRLCGETLLAFIFRVLVLNPTLAAKALWHSEASLGETRVNSEERRASCSQWEEGKLGRSTCKPGGDRLARLM